MILVQEDAPASTGDPIVIRSLMEYISHLERTIMERDIEIQNLSSSLVKEILNDA